MSRNAIEIALDGKVYTLRGTTWYDSDFMAVPGTKAHRLNQLLKKEAKDSLPDRPAGGEPRPKPVRPPTPRPVRKPRTKGGEFVLLLLRHQDKFWNHLFSDDDYLGLLGGHTTTVRDCLTPCGPNRHTRWSRWAHLIRKSDLGQGELPLPTHTDADWTGFLAQFLPAAFTWYRDVYCDGYFNHTNTKPRELLELVFKAAATERLGGWSGAPGYLSFSHAWLRGLVEAELGYQRGRGEPLCPAHLSSWTLGRSEITADELEEAGLKELADQLDFVGSFQEHLLDTPSRAAWTAFVDLLPVHPPGDSPAMKDYLHRTLDVADGLCDLWVRIRIQRGLEPGPPPGDFTTRLCSVIRGRIALERYLEYLDEVSAFAGSTASSTIAWEVLPPGWWRDPQWLQQIETAAGDRTTRILTERFDYLDSLGPEAWHGGQLGEQRTYWVAEFKNYAVAECATEGNALYLVNKKTHTWSEVLSLTKREALKAGAKRIIHDQHGRWTKKLRRLLKAKA